MINDITNSAKNMKKIIFAIEAAPAAIPPKPNIAAINATTKNITVHLNIILGFYFQIFYLSNSKTLPKLNIPVFEAICM